MEGIRHATCGCPQAFEAKPSCSRPACRNSSKLSPSLASSPAPTRIRPVWRTASIDVSAPAVEGCADRQTGPFVGVGHARVLVVEFV